MNLEEYGAKALTTLSTNCACGDVDARIMGQVLGMAGESGEIVEKLASRL